MRVVKTSVVNGRLVASVSCPSGRTCAPYTLTATVTERLRGRTVIGLTAVRTTTRVVTIATARGSVSGGKTVTVKLALNPVGAALLKRHRTLKARVALTAGGKTISTRTVTFTEAKPAVKRQ